MLHAPSSLVSSVLALVVTTLVARGEAATCGDLMRNGIFFDNGTGGAVHCSSSNAPTPCDGCELYDLLANSFGVVPDLCAGGPIGYLDQAPVVDPGVALGWPPVDLRPANGPTVADGFDCSTLDGTFTPTDWIGAVDPDGPNWLAAPWIAFATD